MCGRIRLPNDRHVAPRRGTPLGPRCVRPHSTGISPSTGGLPPVPRLLFSSRPVPSRLSLRTGSSPRPDAPDLQPRSPLFTPPDLLRAHALPSLPAARRLRPQGVSKRGRISDVAGVLPTARRAVGVQWPPSRPWSYADTTGHRRGCDALFRRARRLFTACRFVLDGRGERHGTGRQRQYSPFRERSEG